MPFGLNIARRFLPSSSSSQSSVSPLPGRPAYHYPVKGGMPPQIADHHCSPLNWMDYQHGEIQTSTPTSLRMVGDTLRPCELPSKEHRVAVPAVSFPTTGSNRKRLVHKAQTYAHTRGSELDGTSGYTAQNSPLPDQDPTEVYQVSTPEHQANSRQQAEINHGKMDASTEQHRTVRTFRTNTCDTVRRLYEGIWLYDQLHPVPRNDRQFNEEILHQRPGTSCHLDGNTGNTTREPSDKDHDRQLSSLSSNQQSFINSLPSGRTSRIDLEESFSNEMDHLSISQKETLRQWYKLMKSHLLNYQ